MNRCWRVLTACSLAMALGCAALGAPLDRTAAGDREATLLRRAIAAERHLRYRGERVVEVNRGGRSLRYVEFVEHGDGVTRIDFGKGSPYERQTIVESGGQRKAMDKRGGQIRALAVRQDDGIARLARALRGGTASRLTVRTGPGGRVAGIPTTLIEVDGPGGRRQQSLWLDPKRGLLLRRELFDAQGFRVGFFEFTSLQYDPAFASGALVGADKGPRSIDPSDFALLCKQAGLPVLSLPPSSGFRLVRVRRISPAGARAVAQSYLGPGRARLSLFAVAGKVDLARLQALAGPNLHTCTWRQGGATLVLIGDAPKESLSRLSRLAAGQERGGASARHNSQ